MDMYHVHETEVDSDGPSIFSTSPSIVGSEDGGSDGEDLESEWSNEETVLFQIPREDSGIQEDFESSRDDGPVMTISSISWRGSVLEETLWLQKHVVNQYWRRDEENGPPMVGFQVLVTESQVVRETIWLLAGIQSSFLYELIDGRILLRRDVHVSHLSHESLQALCHPFAAAGQLLLRLQRFIDLVARSPSHTIESSAIGASRSKARSNSGPDPLPEGCRTYQAFAAGLACFLRSFRAELAELEQRAVRQTEPITLCGLLALLDPRLAQLRSLRLVFSTAVRTVPTGVPTLVKASHLLGSLLRSLHQAHCGNDTAEAKLLLWLWVQTLAPYLDIIGGWLIDGRLHDPTKEFLLQRNEVEGSRASAFWFSTYTLFCVARRGDGGRRPRSAPETRLGCRTEPARGWSWDSRCGMRTIADAEHCKDVEEEEEEEEEDVDVNEEEETLTGFLRPVLRQVILTGKSAELLRCLQPKEWPREPNPPTRTLNSYFLESLLTRLGLEGVEGLVKASPSGNTTDEPWNAPEFPTGSQADPLLAHSFTRMFSEKLTFDPVKTEIPFPESLPACQPITTLLQNSLYPHIQNLYHSCCQRLLHTLKTEHSLLQHVHAMRGCLLLTTPALQPFCSALLGVRTRQHPVSLSQLLRNAVGDGDPMLAARLVVKLEKQSRFKKVRPIHRLQGLTLHYQAPWPVDIILGSDEQEAYTRTFQLLLQVAAAACCLQQLCFRDVQGRAQAGPGGATCMRKMFLLRMQLLHFTNTLHQHLLTKVVHGAWCECEEGLDRAVDLDEIIRVHRAFLQMAQHMCLLHFQRAALRGALLHVLDVALTFAMQWKDTGELGPDVVQRLEGEFAHSRDLCLGLLQEAVCQRLGQDLEELYLNLSTNRPNPS
uniref:Gamma-tubulin complex component n=1 Tax=Eptatretus burgeri TaxID=7764 RepID=A0A8C4PXU6_EPTBU